MFKTIQTIVLAMLCSILSLKAQEPINNKSPQKQIIKGTVISTANGEALPGAIIKNITTNQTVTSNNEGYFTLNLPNGKYDLSINYLGYKPLNINIQVPLKEPLVIALEVDEQNLKEVEIVSTGYQNIPKERATGSFTQPNPEFLQSRVAPDIISKLEGITSGLVFNRNTISSNAGKTNISIRGRSTIFANDQPLIIVDNFPFNGDITTINPNDVATVNILKDAAAASIWGARAGNGVIVITTKKGKTHDALNISFNANTTLFQKPDLFYNPNFLSAKDYIEIETFLFDKGKYNSALNNVFSYPVVSPVVQILNEKRKGTVSEEEANRKINAYRPNDIRVEESRFFYRRPVAQQYSLAFSGATERINYYFSTGFDKGLSTLVANDNTRITINSQNTFKPIKNLELTAGLYYIKGSTKTNNTLSLVTGSNSFLPYLKLKDTNGNAMIFDRDYSSAFKQGSIYRGFLDWNFVPLNELKESPIENNRSDTRINTAIKYTLLPGLSAEIKYQYQQINDQGKTHQRIDSYNVRNLINRYSIVTGNKVTGYNIPLGDILSLSNGNTVSNNLRVQIGYQNDWQKHTISAIAGYEISELTSESAGTTYYGYNDEVGTSTKINATASFPLTPSGNGPININTTIPGKLDRIRSSFINLAYTYNHKYTLSGSARIDGSNYFGVKTNQKSVPLWSTGFLWNINQESFYHLSWLPTLRIRLSYGYNGNLDKGNTGITTFRYNPLGATYTNLTFAEIANIGNPQLHWEKIAITNAAIDFALKNQRITGTIEYFWKKGTDILGDKPFAASTGISTLRGNYSNMKSRGMDLSLNSQNLIGRLKWTTSLLISLAHDKVTSYDVIDSYSTNYVGTSNIYPVLGKPVYGVFSYKWAGLDPSNGDPRGYLDNQLSKEYAQIINNTTIDQLEYNGPARPIIFGGIANQFKFQRFSLGFNISYKLGYYFRKATVNYYGMYNISIPQSMNRDFEQRWKKSGDETSTNIPSMGEYSSSPFRDTFYRGSSATVEKGDHIRLQDISLSFDLDRSIWKAMPVKQVQIYLYANNIGILWKANHFGLDPDVVPGLGNTQASPTARNFSIGLKTNL